MKVPRSIAIFGGNGYLGRQICETGIRKGYQITSFSRSGAPSSETSRYPWAQQVKWESADIFKPETYEDKLKGVDAVIHSIGMLFENTAYKSSVNSNFSFFDDISQAVNMIKGPNPMERNEFNTFEAVQRDSALILADAFLKVQPENPAFVYISADQKVPLISEKYISTKREAEIGLLNKPNLRSVIMRPGFMYSEDGNGVTKRDILKHILDLSYASKSMVAGENIGILNQLIRPPVSTRQVSECILKKLEDETFEGVVSLEEIYNGR